MCMMPDIPKPPTPPPPPPPAPKAQDPSVARNRNAERATTAALKGRDGTILTSGLGLTTEASAAKKTLLGS
jgi:hypothetical protein